jgi:hypothetical protein
VGITADPDANTNAFWGRYYEQNLMQPSNAAMVYVSQPATETLNVCGTPLLDLTFAASEDNWQFYTFLYNIDPNNATIGGQMSYGFYTHYQSGPTAGPAAQRNGDGTWTVRGAQLHTICQTLEMGHALGLAIVLSNTAFAPANNATTLAVTMHYGLGTVLHVPTVAWPL